MTLETLNAYFQKNRQACVYDLSRHFDCDTQTLQPDLDQWEKEGILRKRVLSHCCNSGCGQCHTSVYEFYEWV